MVFSQIHSTLFRFYTMFEHVAIYLQIELRIVIIWKGIILIRVQVSRRYTHPKLQIYCYQFKWFFHRYIQLYLIVNYLPHLCHLLIIQKHIFFQYPYYSPMQLIIVKKNKKILSNIKQQMTNQTHLLSERIHHWTRGSMFTNKAPDHLHNTIH
jgi:hypothetical protein